MDEPHLPIRFAFFNYVVLWAGPGNSLGFVSFGSVAFLSEGGLKP